MDAFVHLGLSEGCDASHFASTLDEAQLLFELLVVEPDDSHLSPLAIRLPSRLKHHCSDVVPLLYSAIHKSLAEGSNASVVAAALDEHQLVLIYTVSVRER